MKRDSMYPKLFRYRLYILYYQQRNESVSIRLTEASLQQRHSAMMIRMHYFNSFIKRWMEKDLFKTV